MGSFRVACAVLITLISLIILIVLLDQIVIPNYHGARFKIGICEITTSLASVNENLSNVPWKDCSCGATCTAQFPCVTLFGQHTPAGQNREDKRDGSFHTDYRALKKQCFVVPHCVPVPIENMLAVRDAVQQFYRHAYMHRDFNFKFNCWGLKGEFLTENNYSSKRANLALFLPLLTFVIGLGSLLAASKKVQRFVERCCQTTSSCFEKCCSSCQAEAEADNRIFPMRTRVSDVRTPAQPIQFPVREPPVYVEDEAPPPYSAS